MRLLIVEDDQALAGFLSSALSTESENIEVESDGKQGRQRVVDEQFDLILLDLNLPGCDGVEILSAARQSQRSAAILVLTGRAAVEERVRCLDLGADDCLVKPFALSELIARTRALVRRSHALKESVLYCGDIQMDRVGRTICRAGVPIRLTSTEFALVEFLLLHKGECVSRGQLLEQVWKIPASSVTSIVDVYINYLRRKLYHTTARPIIRTIRGEGYIMREPAVMDNKGFLSAHPSPSCAALDCGSAQELSVVSKNGAGRVSGFAAVPELASWGVA
jgi:DNA-binding response OmpR family regulator